MYTSRSTFSIKNPVILQFLTGTFPIFWSGPITNLLFDFSIGFNIRERVFFLVVPVFAK